MNILYADLTTGKVEQKKSECVPPVGARVGLFNYTPAPTVVEQYWYPPYNEIAKFNLINNHIDVIVFVK